MAVGWLLGRRYRAIRDDLTAFRRHPGRGDAAARLIECAPSFEKAMSIFHDFRLAPLTVQEDSVGSAMADRLRREGPTNDTLKFLGAEGCLERRRQDGGEIDEDSYEWVVMIFEKKLEENGLDGE